MDEVFRFIRSTSPALLHSAAARVRPDRTRRVPVDVRVAYSAMSSEPRRRRPPPGPFVLPQDRPPRRDPGAGAGAGTHAPEALEPPASIFATRGLEVLLALAATVRSPDAPRESIVALLQTAKTALAHYLSPAQRRRLETTASTLRATRAS